MMSDNGACNRSTVHAGVCRKLGIRRIFTQPYRPRTNSKAERFMQTMLRDWASGRSFGSSTERTAALPGWRGRYNHTQPRRRPAW